ncbi:hypothetical protein ADUPG1_009266, partial [Aduncisulcus paluster]
MSRKEKNCEGVIYIGRLPAQFDEKNLKTLFSQFGTITNLRLSRSPKTGISRHFGFVQFQDPEVAEIAADNLNNYILEGHLLQVRCVPPKDVHPMTFSSKYKITRPFCGTKPAVAASRHKFNEASVETMEKRAKRMVEKLKRQLAELEEWGISFDDIMGDKTEEEEETPQKSKKAKKVKKSKSKGKKVEEVLKKK